MILLLTTALTASRSAAQWPKKPTKMTFPSGRTVVILSVDEIELRIPKERGLESALSLYYETKVPRGDTVALGKEINEVWTWLKRDADHRKLRYALVFAQPADHHCAEGNALFSKMPDGSWKKNP